MRYVLAFLFLAIAVAILILYTGTPHGGPTTECGPITFWGHSYTVNQDCRYVSVAEIIGFIVFLLFALITLVISRPRIREY